MDGTESVGIYAYGDKGAIMSISVIGGADGDGHAAFADFAGGEVSVFGIWQ